MKMRLIACFFLFVFVLTASAAVPDSVWIFSYSRPDTSGLRLAWSADGTTWKNLVGGNTVLTCDFGPWGKGRYNKKMYGPRLCRDAETGKWHCVWRVDNEDPAVAHAQSDDLILWTPQTYYSSLSEMPQFMRQESCREAEVIIDGMLQSGYVNRVDFPFVTSLMRYSDQRAYRDMLHSEVMKDDSVRYSGLKPLNVRLNVMPDSSKSISPTLLGIFFEDINYAADGGLYAELIQNRDFEYGPADHQDWNSLTAWTSPDGCVTIDSVAPIHNNNRHYAVVRGGWLANDGYDGIPVKRGQKYLLSLYVAAPQGKVKFKAELKNKAGDIVASKTLTAAGSSWKKLSATLIPTGDADSARLTIRPECDRELRLDMVSLFPEATFKGRKNGLRADLAQTLADLHPKFVRFPGGCVAHGNGVDNIYDWKGSIGPLESRKPLFNIWHYHQSRGLGYHEYLQFCEDIGAEPLPVLAAGVPCQNSRVASAHSHDLVTSKGQQEGIPMERMDEYVADVLDLIEYCNGDAKTTVWGRRRAENGHPAPFNLKFIGIGNEDMITPVFEQRFRMIASAVKERYPEIRIVGTAGPFYEGSDYTFGWRLANEMGVSLVDEHYYVQPGWMINNQDFYDEYDRKGPHVYLGEYAAHLPGRPSNVETALTEALYLLNVERNGDVVEMTSYAPLLAKENHTQWRPDLIYFNNIDVKPTVDYYVQQMFGQNSGTEYIASEISSAGLEPNVSKRLGASVVKDEQSGKYIIKIANLLPVHAMVNLNGIEVSNAEITILSGAPADAAAKPITIHDCDLSSGEIELKPYSFYVIKL